METMAETENEILIEKQKMTSRERHDAHFVEHRQIGVKHILVRAHAYRRQSFHVSVRTV